jgi:hypothetical protein
VFSTRYQSSARSHNKHTCYTLMHKMAFLETVIYILDISEKVLSQLYVPAIQSISVVNINNFENNTPHNLRFLEFMRSPPNIDSIVPTSYVREHSRGNTLCHLQSEFQTIWKCGVTSVLCRLRRSSICIDVVVSEALTTPALHKN